MPPPAAPDLLPLTAWRCSPSGWFCAVRTVLPMCLPAIPASVTWTVWPDTPQNVPPPWWRSRTPIRKNGKLTRIQNTGQSVFLLLKAKIRTGLSDQKLKQSQENMQSALSIYNRTVLKHMPSNFRFAILQGSLSSGFFKL